MGDIFARAVISVIVEAHANIDAMSSSLPSGISFHDASGSVIELLDDITAIFLVYR